MGAGTPQVAELAAARRTPGSSRPYRCRRPALWLAATATRRHAMTTLPDFVYDPADMGALRAKLARPPEALTFPTSS